MHSTISPQQQQAISALLATVNLSEGLGATEEPCSIAAINLALTGRFTDEIPPCMSQVVGEWIIGIQDGMPSDMRNSAEWKRLLPLAAGTGRDREQERQQIIVEWMWAVALPIVQPIADRLRFGAEWRRMLEQQTATTAAAARAAARAAPGEAARAAARSASATLASTWAATTATKTASSADAAAFSPFAAKPAALAASWAAASWAADRSAAANSWWQMDPCALLRCLIDLPPN